MRWFLLFSLISTAAVACILLYPSTCRPLSLTILPTEPRALQIAFTDQSMETGTFEYWTIELSVRQPSGSTCKLSWNPEIYQARFAPAGVNFSTDSTKDLKFLIARQKQEKNPNFREYFRCFSQNGVYSIKAEYQACRTVSSALAIYPYCLTFESNPVELDVAASELAPVALYHPCINQNPGDPACDSVTDVQFWGTSHKRIPDSIVLPWLSGIIQAS